jgi:CubicO group peptidase (beta-lactamase class C family)
MLRWAILVATAAALVWALARLWRVAAIGAAYRSKVLCSIVFGTGRTIDPQHVEDVSADSYWPLRIFRSRVDPAARTVTSSLFGLRSRTAIYRTGLGATVFLSTANLKVRTTSRSSTDLEVGPSRSSADLQVGLSRSVDLPASAEGSGEARQSAQGARRRQVGPSTSSLQRIVDRAFTEPNPKRLRRTRAIVVLHDGEIVAEQYAPGFDAAVRLPGWSMAKSVLNALVGILVGEERLSLQDTALMPQWQPPDPRAAITLEDLLRMRSGLKFSELYSDFSSDVIEMLFNQPDMAAYAARQPLSFPPGKTWSYASGTTNIVSAIVRRTVGDRAYFGWPRAALFDPIGITSATLEPDAAGTFVCSSFMFATARDWARFGQLFLQDGVWEGRRILPVDWVKFSTTPTTPSLLGNFGAHWWLKLGPEIGGGTDAAARIPRDAFFAIGHEAQTLTVIPSQRLVAVRLGLSVYIDAWNQAEFVAELLDAL